MNRDAEKLIGESSDSVKQTGEKGLPPLFYLIPFLHLIIVVPLAFYLNIWADEGSTLYTTENGFFRAFQNTIYDEKQAPLYFLILSLWRAISSSIFFARLFSIIFSLLAIAVFYDLVRNVWNRKTAYFTAFFLAIHPYLIWASLEIRVYSMVIFFSVLLIRLFYGGYLEQKINVFGERKKYGKTQLFFLVTAIFSLYINYYLGFILVGFFVVLLVFGKWSEAKKYFLQMMIVGVSILPLVFIIKMQFSVNIGGYFQETNFVEGLKLLWNHFLTFVLPTEISPPENQTLISLVRLWIVRFAGLLILILLIVKQRIFNDKILIFGIISAVVSAILYLAYFFVSGLYVEIRHAAVLFPPVMLFIIAVLSEILPRAEENANKRKYLLAALAILLFSFYIYGIYALYPNLVKRGDWAQVAQYIEKTESPNQPVIIFSNYEALNLPYYYKGKNRILPDGNFFKWNYEAQFGSEETSIKQIAYVISVIPKESEEIWLVTEDACQETKICVPLEKFIGENYNVLKTKDFYKERVRLLRKK